jgi:YggT family protein
MIIETFLRSFAHVFHMVIQLYILVIIVRAVMSWMGHIPPNTFTIILRRLTDPVFRFVHRVLPFTIIGGIDISPIIIIIALYFIDNFFTGLLLNFAASTPAAPTTPIYE